MSDLNVKVTVPPELRRELDALGGCQRTLIEAAAMGLEAALRDHFQKLQGQPRADGFRPVGFWYGTDGNSVAEQIAGHVLNADGSASILIDSPALRHRLTGGTIKASDYNHPYLTLPATDAAAHAAQGARSFQTHIEWVLHPDGGIRPALVSGPKRSKPDRESADTDVLFWLVRQVSHRPMPEALPSDSTLVDAARDAALDALDALTQEAA